MRGRFELVVLVWLLMAGAAALLSGCATPGEQPPEIVYKEVKVAVATGCVVDRPEEVQPLNKRIPADTWASLAPGAKAQAVKAQAGDRLNYEDELRAATAGCPEAQPPK